MATQKDVRAPESPAQLAERLGLSVHQSVAVDTRA